MHTTASVPAVALMLEDKFDDPVCSLSGENNDVGESGSFEHRWG